MARSLEIIKSSPADAITNMEQDYALFKQLESGKSNTPVIRLYSWEQDCVTFGRSQKPENDFNTKLIPDIDKVFAIRPTGGGMVFHSVEDLTYCIVAPIENDFLPTGIEAGCSKMHEIISLMLSEIGISCSVKKCKPNKKKDSFEKICFTTSARYELSTSNGLKIAGSAQKKGKKALMIQGHIPNKTNYDVWSNYSNNQDFIEKVKKNSTTIFKETKKEFSFRELSDLFIKHFSKNYATDD